MEITNASPSTSPTLDQQRDALRKGLGRAVQWARAGKLADEPLLAACLKEQRYDTQLEESRAEWLWKMIRELGAVDRFLPVGPGDPMLGSPTQMGVFERG